MILRNNLLKQTVSPVIADAIRALAQHTGRNIMKQAGNITAMTDNSTGAGGSALAAVPIQAAKVAQSGSNLARFADVNTALTAADNAITVLLGYLNTYGLTTLGLTNFATAGGTIAVAGTVPALTKTVTGVDGSAVKATGTLTTTGTFSNNETVTIGGKVYTMQTVLTNVDGNVLIGANAAASLSNLAAAINLGAGSGSTYAAATTANANVSATATATTLVVTALVGGTAGNAITTTETAANASFGGGTLAGGLATGEAVLRSEFNSAISRARNNLSTVVTAYNDIALAVGKASLIDATSGTSSQAKALSSKVAVATAVAASDVATSDLATKAAADAALTALANNIATIASKINSSIFNNSVQLHDTVDTVVLI